MGRRTIDLVGKKFHSLTVLSRVNKSNIKAALWLCECDCGNKVVVASYDLRHGRKTNCGCITREMQSKSKLKDISGWRFGRLTAIERVGFNKHGKSTWKCKCDCGNLKEVDIGNLSTGRTQSCGCLHRETFNNVTHNESKTRLYRIWHAVKERCGRPKAINYKWYGGKGIKVCQEWSESFEAFRDWAVKNGYSDELTIDRIDPDLDYSPQNCRWITRAENIGRSAKEMQKRRKENGRHNANG